MNSFSIDRIVFVRYGSDAPGNEYRNYIKGRGVCGMVYVIEGCAEYEFSDGRKRSLKAGEIAVFSEKTAYSVRNSGDCGFLHYTVNFALSERHSLPADETYLSPENTAEYEALCRHIYESTYSGHPSSHMFAMSSLYQALGKIYSDNKVELSDRKEYLSILPAVSLIEADCSKKITVETLAKACLMSCTSFRRVFRTVCGTSPAEYLIRKRISKAKALLKHTGLNISEISVECGFKDTEHFCRTFKARCGLTAAAYRKECE